MKWMKATEAAQYCGGISEKLLYSAARNGQLKVARVGAGRNMLFCEEWCDEFLKRSAESQAQAGGK